MDRYLEGRNEEMSEGYDVLLEEGVKKVRALRRGIIENAINAIKDLIFSSAYTEHGI